MKPSQSFPGRIGRFLVIALWFTSAVLAQETNCIPRPEGLVAWWPGDGTALDLAVTNPASLLGRTSYAPGKAGLAFLFDGVDDAVNVGPRADLVLSNTFSIEAWVFPTGPGSSTNGGTIVCKEGEYIMTRFADGSLRWALAKTNNTWGWTNTGFVIPSNQWTHLVLTASNGLVSSFANASLVHTVSIGAGNLGDVVPAMNDFRIGGRQYGSGQFFQGLIDEVSIYSGALDSSQIAALYAAGTVGKCRPPWVVSTSPVLLAFQVPTNAVITATFSEAMDPSSVDASTFLLLDRQSNAVPGTVAYDPATLTATLTPSGGLLEGSYYFATIKKEVRNTQGANLATDYTWHFATTGLVCTIFWIGGSGDWSSPGNWSEGRVPAAEDDVLIDDPAAELTITLSGGSQSIRSLVSREQLRLTGGSLALAGTMHTSGSVTLAGGTIRGGTVVTTNGAGLVVTASSVLDGVTMQADLLMRAVENRNSSVVLTVRNRLTLDGTITMRRTQDESGAVILLFEGAQTFWGTGQVVFQGPDWRNNAMGYNFVESSGGQLTIGPGITIRGQIGIVGDSSTLLVNRGTIRADVSGHTITVKGSSVANYGTMEAINGGSLSLNNIINHATCSAVNGSMSLGDAWTNAGVLTVSNSTLNLGSSFTLATLGMLERTGGVVNLTGTLLNTNTTLALDQVTGSWNLAGGTILGGRIVGTNGAGLVVTASSALDGVTMQADVLMRAVESRNSSVGPTVRNRLTLDGTITMRRTQDESGAVILLFEGTQSLLGTGQVVFQGPDWRNNAMGYNFVQSSGGQLTIGPGITIRGQIGIVGNSSMPLMNQGTIRADVSGHTITVQGSSGTNYVTRGVWWYHNAE